MASASFPRAPSIAAGSSKSKSYVVRMTVFTMASALYSFSETGESRKRELLTYASREPVKSSSRYMYSRSSRPSRSCFRRSEAIGTVELPPMWSGRPGLSAASVRLVATN